MPAKPAWFVRIPDILARLVPLEVPVLDRSAIEQLFRLKRRQAIQLMHRLGGYESGNSLLIDRTQLLARLEEIERSPDVHYELRRREKLAEVLDGSARFQAGARVRIPVTADTLRRTVSTLPGDVDFRPGLLQIRFRDTEDLLEKLFGLAQAAANDFEDFSARAEGSAVRQTA